MNAGPAGHRGTCPAFDRLFPSDSLETSVERQALYRDAEISTSASVTTPGCVTYGT